MTKFLIKYETRQIQKYIYSSSKIKEIVGASDIVRNNLRSSLYEACRKFNLRYDDKEDLSNKFKFRDTDLDFQIAYEGGGNLTCFLYSDETLVHKFNRYVGYLFLKNTYSLKLCYAYVEASDDFKVDRKKLDRKISDLKVSMPFTTLQGTLPIVMSSTDSSLPLSEIENDRKITKESRYKLDQYNELNKKIKNDYNKKFLDDLVDKGDDSYLAIVHIDANDLGVAIKNYFAENGKNDISYEDKVNRSRDVSEKIKTKFNDKFDSFIKEYMDKVVLKSEAKNKIGYRIIVNSGDDITFIVYNMYAIDIVTKFLTQINKESFFDNDIKISACAGITFCKSHFPYNRAYDIAEQLCESAKKKAKSEKERKENKGQSRCAFDYYICQSGILKSVEEIEDEYKIIKLYSKPYFVNRNQMKRDDYETLKSNIDRLLKKDLTLSKSKEIRNAYEKSKDETALTFSRINSRLKESEKLEPLDKNGFANYYDASTLIDFTDFVD